MSQLVERRADKQSDTLTFLLAKISSIQTIVKYFNLMYSNVII